MLRFGITAGGDAEKSSAGEMTEGERQKVLKRKERFGEVMSSLVSKVRLNLTLMYATSANILYSTTLCFSKFKLKVEINHAN